MEKLSVRKFSILGVVLMSASAVIATVIPSKVKSNSAFVGNGIIRVGAAFDSDDEQPTCKPATSGQNCNNTVSAAASNASRNTNKGGSLSNNTTLGDGI